VSRVALAEAVEQGLENPFTTEYLEKEIQFYNPVPYAKDGLVLKLKSIKHPVRIDEYLNKQMVCEGPAIPILTFDGTIWMSLTWLEVESHWVPFQTFGGDILVGGLGMGYAALRFAAMEHVDSVTVYETDKRVIDFFQATQGDRPEQAKIRVIHEDIHKAQGRYEFAFIDIYPTLLPDELLRDARFFCESRPGLSIMETPHFWGQELAWLTLMQRRVYKPFSLSYVERTFFEYWWKTDKPDLAREIEDVRFCSSLAKVMGRVED